MSAVSDARTEKYLVDEQHLQFVWYTLERFTNNFSELQDLKIEISLTYLLTYLLHGAESFLRS